MQANFFNRSLYKANAKRKLKDNWPVACAIVLVYFVFQSFWGLGMRLLPDVEFFISNVGSLPSVLFSEELTPALTAAGALGLFSCILMLILNLASFKWALNVSVGSEAVGIGDFMAGFKFFLKAIGAGIWQQIWLTLWNLLFCVPAIIAIAFGILARSGHFGEEMVSLGTIAIIIGVVLYFLSVIVSVVKMISYSQMFFVLAEEKIGIMRSMRISKALTRNYIFDLLVLELSFILWWLVGVITFFIAMFYVYPYYLLTKAEAYVYLRDDAFEKGVLDPREFGLMKISETLEESNTKVEVAETYELAPVAEKNSAEDTQIISSGSMQINSIHTSEKNKVEEPKTNE